ncbi:MAG TPA: hypothetical protein VGN81_01885 [Pseudonocardiaceae bacterium]
MAVPSRRAGALRERLGVTDRITRRVALLATWRTVRANWRTGGPGRRALVPVAALCWLISHQMARWAPGSALVVTAGSSVVVLARRGRWLLVDAAGWPVGAGRARQLLAGVCARADVCGMPMALLAANSTVAAKVYVPLGFRPIRSGARRYVRAPVV